MTMFRTLPPQIRIHSQHHPSVCRKGTANLNQHSWRKAVSKNDVLASCTYIQSAMILSFCYLLIFIVTICPSPVLYIDEPTTRVINMSDTHSNQRLPSHLPWMTLTKHSFWRLHWHVSQKDSSLLSMLCCYSTSQCLWLYSQRLQSDWMWRKKTLPLLLSDAAYTTTSLCVECDTVTTINKQVSHYASKKCWWWWW